MSDIDQLQSSVAVLHTRVCLWDQEQDNALFRRQGRYFEVLAFLVLERQRWQRIADIDGLQI